MKNKIIVFINNVNIFAAGNEEILTQEILIFQGSHAK